MIFGHQIQSRPISATEAGRLRSWVLPHSILSAIVGLFVILAMPGMSFAQQSATCRSLQAQLATIETGRGSQHSDTFIKYDRAMKDQLKQIKKTERAATRNGCQVFRSNVCNRINSSLQSMYANMESLRRIRDSSGGGGATRGDREKVLSALDRNGCIESAALNPEEGKPSRRRTLLEQIFGDKTYSDQSATGFSNPDLNSQYGTFRTLCVRSCDGYYFPISFSTTKNRFDADPEQCQLMCPGSETALFYQPMPNGDAEESISYRTGEPYASLSNAFSYRKNVNSECSCRMTTGQGGFEEIAGATASENEPALEPAPAVPTPTFRADKALDLETDQNLAGGMTLEKLAALTGKKETENVATKEIRIVGPEFFPVQ